MKNIVRTVLGMTAAAAAAFPRLCRNHYHRNGK